MDIPSTMFISTMTSMEYISMATMMLLLMIMMVIITTTGTLLAVIIIIADRSMGKQLAQDGTIKVKQVATINVNGTN